MSQSSAACHYTAPILVLALGEPTCGDEGLGPTLLKELQSRYRYAGGFVEFLECGTRGARPWLCSTRWPAERNRARYPC
jgi:hypothetical protein